MIKIETYKAIRNMYYVSRSISNLCLTIYKMKIKYVYIFLDMYVKMMLTISIYKPKYK